jgi:hypothetical protein
VEFGRGDGAFSRAQAPTHGEAVRLAYQDNWFSEYCFTRFNLLAIEGRWQGLTDMSGPERDLSGKPVNDPHGGQCGRAHAARLAAAR